MCWRHPSEVARDAPDRIAYVMAATGRMISYAKLDARSNRLAQFWRTGGLQAGDVIALVVENHEWVFPLVWSAQRSGLLFVSLSTSLAAGDLAYILRDCGAAFVVYSERTAERVESAMREAPGTTGLRLEGTDGLIERIAALPAHPVADETMGSDMLYSSGTTGRPKGIRRVIEPGAPIDTATVLDTLVERRYGFTADTRYLCPAPLYHAAPLRWSMAVLRIGGLVVVMDRFDAEAALALIERHRLNAAQWVPTHFVRMLKLPEETRATYDVSSLHIAIHAAAPCPVPVKQAMIDWWGPILSEYYSATEANGFTAIDSAEWLERPGSVGRALIGTIRICGEDGEELPPREAGDIYFENGQPFSYHNDPDKTAAATNARGWTTLGDVGWVDEAGYLYLTDRRNFMIISGGVNIYPQEIENLLITHPAVRDAAVIGIPDAEMGESVCAVVELMNGAEAGAELAETLRSFAREKLGPIKAPRRVDFAESLPREPTGKLYKRLLRDQYRAEAQAG
ncbi:acyl-CoA synthetase [Sphingomonas sp. CGMCC 1.13654]|uniref:Acyl-CoA synthetase n=1 Tax=Sphingomonas chungangi TaxID=2683589 RepID=A0A838L4I2_9SPHN|nr:acyl-CoA synthetase [Sphingomonas chungangi]MBA2933810.1 acyl-CoA synthetase [Sphingomonas chungangi]MVW55140.1 AMP-binding protein [Sphingomonas chungangi]